MERSSAKNSKLFASPVALSKVEKGRKSTFFLQNNLFFSSKQPVVVPPQDRSSRRTHCSCQPCRATSRAEEAGTSTSSYLSLSLQKVMAHCLSFYWQSTKHFCLFYLKAKPGGDWRRVNGSTIWKKCTGRLEDWKT